MPAPAVIPAPKAYINAVAVKGFVVELRASKAQWFSPIHFGLVTHALVVREQTYSETKNTGVVPFLIIACHACQRAPVIFYCD